MLGLQFFISISLGFCIDYWNAFQKRNGVFYGGVLCEMDFLYWGSDTPLPVRAGGVSMVLWFCFYLYSLFSPRFARVGRVRVVKQVLAAGRQPASYDRGKTV